MSSTNDANRFVLPDNLTHDYLFAVGDAIGVGDLMYDQGADVARPADKQTDQGSLAANQLYFAQRFCGVSQQQILAAETNATKRLSLRTEGAMEFACQSATFRRGDYLGVDENDAGDACNPQRVIAVTDQAKAIAVVTRNYATATTRVRGYFIAGRASLLSLGPRAAAGVDGSATTAGQAGRDVDLKAGNGGAKSGTGAAAGGAGGAADVTAGSGGNTASSGSDAGGAGGAVTVSGGAGGNATAGTGNGGAGGHVNLVPGDGGTTTGGAAGADGAVQVNGKGFIPVTYVWDTNAQEVDQPFFVAAGQAYRVRAIIARPRVVDGAATTGTIKKAASATATASGTAVHTGTIDFNTGADTNQSLTLSATAADLLIPEGTSLGMDFSGALTNGVGVVTVMLEPLG